MKRLTRQQLVLVGVSNGYEFGAPFFLHYFAGYRHATTQRKGWHLRPFLESMNDGFIDIGNVGYANRLKPADLRKLGEPILKAKFDAEWPDEWVKIFDEWIPKGFHDRRMAELCEQYKELKKKEKAS
jgi:hypothetical protein